MVNLLKFFKIIFDYPFFVFLVQKLQPFLLVMRNHNNFFVKVIFADHWIGACKRCKCQSWGHVLLLGLLDFFSFVGVAGKHFVRSLHEGRGQECFPISHVSDHVLVFDYTIPNFDCTIIRQLKRSVIEMNSGTFGLEKSDWVAVCHPRKVGVIGLVYM